VFAPNAELSVPPDRNEAPMNLASSLRNSAIVVTCAATIVGLCGAAAAFGAAKGSPVDPPGTQLLTSPDSGFPDVPQLWTTNADGVVYTDTGGTWLQPRAGGSASRISGAGSQVIGATGGMVWIIDGTGVKSWYNTGSGASGHIAPGWRAPSTTGGLYELLSPTGTIHVMNQNAMTDRLTDLGAVGYWSSRDALVPGPTGVLVVGKRSNGTLAMTYMTYSGRDTTPDLTGIPAAHTIKCVSVSAAGAGCIDQTANAAIGVSVTGGSPTYVVADSAISSGPVLTATTMAWTVRAGAEDILHSVPLAGGAESVMTAPKLGTGKGILSDGASVYIPTAGVTAGDNGSIATVTDASGTPSDISDDPPLALSTYELGIGPGRVSWADNGTMLQPLWSRTDGASSYISLGQQTNIANGLTANGVFVSGPRTAFDNSAGYPVVTDGVTTMTVPQPGTVVGLSGTRLLYMRTGGYHPMLYDLVTNRPTDLITVYPSMTPQAPVALWGNYLTFFQNNGSVWRVDLTSGRGPVQIASAQPAGRTIVYGALRESGNWVAWSLITTDGTSYYTQNQYVDATSGDTPTNVPAQSSIVGVSEAGLILTRNNQSSLQSWDGINTMDIPGTDVVSNGDRVAWVGSDGVPRIAQVSYPVSDRSWALSPAVTTATLDLNDSWSFDLSTSAPLTNCSVSFIDRTGVTVDTVPCDAAAAAQGEARVTWVPPLNVPFGIFTAQLNAGNADGALLAGDGSSTKFTTAVTVAVNVSSVSPTSLPQGATGKQIIVYGNQFDANATPFFGLVVHVTSVVVNSPHKLTATVTILPNAAIGSRSVVVSDLGSVDGTCYRCFTVTTASS
jgi:hypothetical protein